MRYKSNPNGEVGVTLNKRHRGHGEILAALPRARITNVVRVAHERNSQTRELKGFVGTTLGRGGSYKSSSGEPG